MNRLFVISGRSIVFSGNFEVALGMIADGADFGSLGAHHDVAAVAAFPDLDFALFKDLSFWQPSFCPMIKNSNLMELS